MASKYPQGVDKRCPRLDTLAATLDSTHAILTNSSWRHTVIPMTIAVVNGEETIA
jgi:hypothetical protein